jgi:uncharacterized membrane protein (DUF485 family)
MSLPDSSDSVATRRSHDDPPWEDIAKDADFRHLLAAKIRFIAPATVFFLVYYFALPVLVGYAPKLMATPIWGDLNAAYLFALSQFFMAWILAAFYVRAAASWDRAAAAVLRKFGRK